MDTGKSKELWERLENEPERAYDAFERYLTLPTGNRTLLEAYRQHVGNLQATKPSDTWSRWSGQFAWRERAAAYDDHLASLRRAAYERGIEKEAERQAALAERVRGQMNELMTLSYEEAMEWLENKGHEEMRFGDVVQIARLHLDAVKVFGITERPKDDDWTEEDDDCVETILKKMKVKADESDDGHPEEKEGE